MYELKEEKYAEYNPFFYHYSRQEQTAAMDVQRARCKQLERDQGNILNNFMSMWFSSSIVTFPKML